MARQAVHLRHNADDPVLRHRAQSATPRDALAFERSPGAGSGLSERRWVLLGGFGEEHMVGVLAETGHPAQGRALREFREGGECGTFRVLRVRSRGCTSFGTVRVPARAAGSVG